MLGIGFPVYFRDAPGLVYELIARLQGQERPVFFFCTRGLYSGNAVRNSILAAASRGFQAAGEVDILMPGTDSLILLSKQGWLTENILKRIHSRNLDDRVSRFLDTVLETASCPVPGLKWYTPLDDYIIKPLETHFTNQHRDYYQFYFDPDTCTACMKCVENCPKRISALADFQRKQGRPHSVRNKVWNMLPLHPPLPGGVDPDWDNHSG